MPMTRREFLKGAAAMAAGAMLPDNLIKTPKAEAAVKINPKDVLNYNPKMQYRPMGRTGVNVSALGFGMLRLPMLADGKTVDVNQTVDMVHRAIEGGVNYIDTGRVYLGGQSELAVGEALGNAIRAAVSAGIDSQVAVQRTSLQFRVAVPVVCTDFFDKAVVFICIAWLDVIAVDFLLHDSSLLHLAQDFVFLCVCIGVVFS